MQDRLFPSDEELKTLETPHFRVIFQAPLEELAPRIAEYCEEAYFHLSRLFGWAPESKIDVLFLDSVDTHNGWASTIPHTKFVLYLSGSEPGAGIYQPHDYLKRTVFHELTHVFTMDMNYGHRSFLSSMFGRVLPSDFFSSMLFFITSPPANMTPRWFLEGAAIWAETEYAPPGRGKSSYSDMIFRCAVRDDNLLPYSEWYLEIPHYSYGEGAYLYGMKFFEYFYTHCEWMNSMGELFQTLAQSSQPNIDPVLTLLCNKNAEELACAMLTREMGLQQEKLAHLRTLKEQTVKRLTPKELMVHGPVFAGNKVYFLGQEEERRSSIYEMDPKTGICEKRSDHMVTPAHGNLAIARDQGQLYFNRLEMQGSQNLWYEVRRIDLQTKEEQLVTREGRYRAIDVTQDGARLAAVSQRRGRFLLVEADLLNNTRERVLQTAPLEVGLYSPRYSPDGNRIVYVETMDRLYRLKVYDLTTHEIALLHESQNQILTPRFHSNGASVIYCGDDNGVFNFYEIDAEGTRPLTHVTGGLFAPDLSPDSQTLTGVCYDGFGAHLALFPYEPFGLKGKSLPKVGPSWKGKQLVCFMQNGEETEPVKKDQFIEPEDYNSFSSLRFDFWSPWLIPSGKGLEIGAISSFTDPAEYQDIKLFAGHETRYDSPLAALHYTYKGLYPEIQLYGVQEQEIYDDLLMEKNALTRYDYGEENARFGASVTLPLIKMDHQVHWRLGYEYKMRNPIDSIKRRVQGKNLALNPTDENEGSFWTKITYMNGAVFKRSASVEDGRLITLAGEVSRSWLGGDLSRERALLQWDEYLGMPWAKNHVLKVTAAYGKGSGDKTAQGAFSLGGVGNAVSDLTPGLPNRILIRGYSDNFQTGQSAVKASAAYRFPIMEFNNGSEGYLPLYTSQLFGEVFFDSGRTWDSTGKGDDLRWIHSFGVETNISIKLLRYMQFAPGLGLAFTPDNNRNHRRGDDFSLYFTIKAWVNF